MNDFELLLFILFVWVFILTSIFILFVSDILKVCKKLKESTDELKQQDSEMEAKSYIEERIDKDNEKLDRAINHYAELSKERYLYNPHNKDLYEWLKELRDRRK